MEYILQVSAPIECVSMTDKVIEAAVAHLGLAGTVERRSLGIWDDGTRRRDRVRYFDVLDLAANGAAPSAAALRDVVRHTIDAMWVLGLRASVHGRPRSREAR